ncbi:MAG: phytanoyl-CoA dioxygenase family protein [Pirellulales bacterium]
MVTEANISNLLAQYEHNGVVHVPCLFNSTEVVEIRQRTDDYIRDRLAQLPSTDYVLEADGRSVRNLWRMHEHDPLFAALAQRPHIRSLAAALVHGEPVLMSVETFNKPARVGSAVPYHQDNAYFCQTPPDVLTVWVAIDAATIENGAVYYLPETHRQGVLPHKLSGVRGNSMSLADPSNLDTSKELLGALASGDAMIHHCQTIHRSAPNTSGRPRCGLLLVYRGAHTRDDPELKVRYDQALALSLRST